jgi:hypothetical protein
MAPDDSFRLKSKHVAHCRLSSTPLTRPSAIHKTAITMLFSKPKYRDVTSQKKTAQISQHKDNKRNVFSTEAIKTGFRNAKFKLYFSLLYKYSDK